MIGLIREYAPNIRFIAGIDEAGRGPLAGPVAIGLVVVPIASLERVQQTLFTIKDSKKLSPQKRAIWADIARDLEFKVGMRSTTALVGPGAIERHGITRAIKIGMKRALTRTVEEPEETYLLLDGGLRAAPHFSFQETIVRGDSKEPLIALAAILAKVRRDAYMSRKALAHPEYAFEQHKGYGTAEHLKRIRLHGLSPLHRPSFVHR